MEVIRDASEKLYTDSTGSWRLLVSKRYPPSPPASRPPFQVTKCTDAADLVLATNKKPSARIAEEVGECDSRFLTIRDRKWPSPIRRIGRSSWS